MARRIYQYRRTAIVGYSEQDFGHGARHGGPMALVRDNYPVGH